MGSLVWLHIHWVFWGIALFGFVAGIIWLNKYAKKESVKKIMTWTIIIGVIGGLLTVPVSMRGWFSMMSSFGGHHGMIDSEKHDAFMEKMMESGFNMNR